VAQPGGSLSDLFPGGLGRVLSENFIRSGFAPTRRAANRYSIIVGTGAVLIRTLWMLI
jgi:hypothetical protein